MCRFKVVEDTEIGCYYIMDTLYGESLMLFDVKEHIISTCDLLNKLHDRNVESEKDYNRLRECIIEIYLIAKNEGVY